MNEKGKYINLRDQMKLFLVILGKGLISFFMTLLVLDPSFWFLKERLIV